MSFNSSKVLRFVPNDGGQITLSDFRAAPLPASNIIHADTDSYLYKLTIQAQTIQGLPEHETVAGEAKLTISFPQKLLVYSLEERGWLPLPLSNAKEVLLDRNVVNSMERIRRIAAHKTDRQNALEWWFSFFDGGSIRLSPIYYAMEGNTSQIPTLDQFSTGIDEAAASIRSAFPGANVRQLSSNDVLRIYSVVEDFTAQHEAKTRFLLRACPLLVDRKPDTALLPTLFKLLELSERYGISRRSFIFCAALSCLFESRHGSALLVGRALLKPKREYTKKAAYNALSDLTMLDLTAALKCLFGENIGFCTCDRALAAFWAGISPTNFSKPIHSVSSVEYQISLSPEIFPRLSDEHIHYVAMH